MVIYKNIINITSDVRSGKPCIRDARITVEDILKMFASQMTFDDIVEDFPELTFDDIHAALEYSANRQHRTLVTQ